MENGWTERKLEFCHFCIMILNQKYKNVQIEKPQ